MLNLESSLFTPAIQWSQAFCTVDVDRAFEEPEDTDATGKLARMRPFEEAIHSGDSMFLESCLERYGIGRLLSEHSRWLSGPVQAQISPKARRWREGASWLHLACASPSPKSVSFLLRLGFDPDPQDSSGASPLGVLAIKHRGGGDGASASASLLIQAGSNPWRCDFSGLAPASIMPNEWQRYASRRCAAELNACLNASEALLVDGPLRL